MSRAIQHAYGCAPDTDPSHDVQLDFSAQTKNVRDCLEPVRCPTPDDSALLKLARSLIDSSP